MANYPIASVEVTNKQTEVNKQNLNKLKSAGTNKTGRILRLNKKNLKMKNWHINYF